jgi:hypothetical protein
MVLGARRDRAGPLEDRQRHRPLLPRGLPGVGPRRLPAGSGRAAQCRVGRMTGNGYRGGGRARSVGNPIGACSRGPTTTPTPWICARIESPKRCGEGGWLHPLRADGPTWAPWRRTMRRAAQMTTRPEPAALDFGVLAAGAEAAVRPERLGALALSLGVSVESLGRLAVGWLPSRRAWSFPMRDAAGTVVGIRLRFPSGRKLSAKGGREGLFIPSGIGRGARRDAGIPGTTQAGGR